MLAVLSRYVMMKPSVVCSYAPFLDQQKQRGDLSHPGLSSAFFSGAPKGNWPERKCFPTAQQLDTIAGIISKFSA